MGEMGHFDYRSLLANKGNVSSLNGGQGASLNLFGVYVLIG